MTLNSSKFSQYFQQLAKLAEKYDYIKAIHVLTFFMVAQTIQQFENNPVFKLFKFYPLILNNELMQYHCLKSNGITSQESSLPQTSQSDKDSLEDRLLRSGDKKDRVMITDKLGELDQPQSDAQELKQDQLIQDVNSSLKRQGYLVKNTEPSTEGDTERGTLDSLCCFRSFY